jgi:hypothetical protein
MVFKFGTRRTHGSKKEINTKFQPCKLEQETILDEYHHYSPVPVAAQTKTKVCGRFLLRLWVRIPPGTWMFVCCEICVCCQVEDSATS